MWGIPYSISHTPFQRGFTLIEILIAFAIFAIIMVMAVGSFISLLEANYKAQALKTVVNNLHFALENMSRNIRTGSTYHCGSGGDLSAPRDCADTPESTFVFVARDGSRVAYRRNGNTNAIERSIASSPYTPLTASDVQVETLHFYVDGADPSNEPGSNEEQPRVLIVAKGWMKGKSKVVSRFDIQTLVSQRLLDI